MIDPKTIREESIAEALRLGYPVNMNLPLLEIRDEIKSRDEVANRLLCLYAVVACSYGFDCEKAIAWLDQEALTDALTPLEKRYLESANDRTQMSNVQWQVEALWTLAWCLECYKFLDFSDSCSDEFIDMLPDLVRNESPEGFRRNGRVRSKEEIFAALDLAYCLHWAVRDAELHGRATPGKLPGNVIVERRRALEWIVGDQAWDDISLDT